MAEGAVVWCFFGSCFLAFLGMFRVFSGGLLRFSRVFLEFFLFFKSFLEHFLIIF